MAYYINFERDVVRKQASKLGFDAATWKQDLLDKLLVDGSLEFVRTYDPYNANTVLWQIRGPSVAILAEESSNRSDLLICAHPMHRRGRDASREKGPAFVAKGPWLLDTTQTKRKPVQVTVHQFLLGLESAAHRSQQSRGSPGGLTQKLFAPSISGQIRPAVHAADREISQAALGMSPGVADAGRLSQGGDEKVPGPNALRDETVRLDVRESGGGSTDPTAHESPIVGNEAPAPAASPIEVDAVASSRSAQLSDVPPEGVTPEAARLVPPTPGESVASEVAPTPGAAAPAPTGVPAMGGTLGASVPPADGEAVCVPLSAPDWSKLALKLLFIETPGLAGVLDSADPQLTRQQRIRQCEAELARIQAELLEIPSDEQIELADVLVRRIGEIGPRLLEAPPPNVVFGSAGTLSTELERLDSDAARLLPAWVVGAREASEVVPRVLTKPEVRGGFHEALEWIDQHFAGAPPPVLAEVSPPTRPSGNVVADLQASWSESEAFRQVAARIPAEWRRLLRDIPLVRMREFADIVGVWSDALHPAAFREMLEHLSGPERPFARLAAFPDVAALSRLDGDERDNLRDLTKLDRALKHVRKHSEGPAAEVPFVNDVIQDTARISPERSVSAAGRVIEFDHVVNDAAGRVVSATVYVPEPARGDRTVVLQVPLRILADAQLRGGIEVAVTCPAIDLVPQDERLPRGMSFRTVGKGKQLNWKIAAAPTRWRFHKRDEFSREETLSLPITLGFATDLRTGKETSLTLRLTSGDVSSSLAFQRFSADLPAGATGSGMGSEDASTLVKNNPMGAQANHGRLEGVIREGRRTFMVVAPRQFGKTTLYKHLSACSSAAGHCTVGVPILREGTTEEGVATLWQCISSMLSQKYGATPITAPYPATMFERPAWAAIRSFLGQKKIGTLVVLVDEAQVLVPRVGGARWGSEFRNLVEMALSEPESGLSVVQFALFGTVDLKVRMGQNCRDFLLTFGSDQYEFDEGSLDRYLRWVGKDSFETSKAARRSLARWASNLPTLSRLFDMVRAQVVDNMRTFILDADVDSAVEDLLRDPNALPESLWNYTRSELSHKDEPWDPIDAFPLAVGWARPEFQAMGTAQRLEACLKWLNTQLADLGVNATVPMERGQGALADLRARGVVRPEGNEFYRPLLHEMLAKKQHVLVSERESQLALLRLAVDTVVWPAQAEPRGGGAQAQIFLADRGERASTYRLCQLTGDDDRTRFARTCAALRPLRNPSTRQEGDQHLPRVTAAGFRADDPSQGVIVYDWIEGQPLEAIWGKLPGQARAYVAKQVAAAVAALHARDVIHCDVAPRNVLVNSKLDATLIDFGLARRVCDAGSTILHADDFKAPEQYANPPRNVKGSDVHAIGMILRGLKHHEPAPPGLASLVERMVDPVAERRPNAAEAARELESLIRYEPALEQSSSALDDLIMQAPEPLWGDLEAFRRNAASAHAWSLPFDENRAMEVANMLNVWFARIVSERRGTVASRLADLRPGDEFSLASVRGRINGKIDPALVCWTAADVRAVGLLRHAWVHTTARKVRLLEARRELSVVEGPVAIKAFRSALVSVAVLLDDLVAPGSKVIREFVGYFGV